MGSLLIPWSSTVGSSAPSPMVLDKCFINALDFRLISISPNSPLISESWNAIIKRILRKTIKTALNGSFEPIVSQLEPFFGYFKKFRQIYVYVSTVNVIWTVTNRARIKRQLSVMKHVIDAKNEVQFFNSGWKSPKISHWNFHANNILHFFYLLHGF